MITFDTSELLRPTPRNLHTAWQELEGEKVCMTITTGRELAPYAVEMMPGTQTCVARGLLDHPEEDQDPERDDQLKRQVWWDIMWRNPEHPYELIRLTPEEQEVAAHLQTEIPAECFPLVSPKNIPEHPDARIVTETIAIGATMLLTSNLRSIDHEEINKWAKTMAPEWGRPVGEVVRDADEVLVEATRDSAKLEQLVQAGFIACWPDHDNASTEHVVGNTIRGFERLGRGGDTQLIKTAARMLNRIDKHPDLPALVEATRRLLPSKTIERTACIRRTADAARTERHPLEAQPDMHDSRLLKNPE